MPKYCGVCLIHTRRYANGDCSPCALRRYKTNKQRILSRHSAWAKDNRSAEQRKQNARRYGLTLEQYDNMLQEQAHCCKACREEFTKTPHVDHDHACCPGKLSCGKCVRGLLCGGCNTTLGFMQDSPDKLAALADYLIVTRRMPLCQITG